MKIFENRILCEKYYFLTLDSGMKVYLIPKKGYKHYFAILGAPYGSFSYQYKINDIKYLREKEKFNELPEQLREIAEIREENPDASLEELGKLLKNPIGKSGVNHRLRKIQQIAEELRK